MENDDIIINSKDDISPVKVRGRKFDPSEDDLIDRERSGLEEKDIYKNTRERLVPDHYHNGRDASKIKLRDLQDFWEVVDVIPTHAPRNVYEQVKLYVSGVTVRLYIYDYKARTWRYV